MQLSFDGSSLAQKKKKKKKEKRSKKGRIVKARQGI